MKRLLALLAAATALACADARKEDGGGTNPRPPLTKIPEGVVGYVIDTAGSPVANATVYLVPSSAIPQDPLPVATTATSDQDEPLEDAIAAGGGAFASASTDEKGVYTIATVGAGSYFLTVVPDGEAAHLPGGSECRTARSESQLRNQQVDVELSPATPAGASFVGSSQCTACHQDHEAIKGTMHRLGIWSPYGAGALQDVSVRQADLYQAFGDKFEAAGGTTVYFYGYDSSRSFDKYKTSETAPGTPAALDPWASGSTYAVGAQVVNDGKEYEATTAGTSGSTPPTGYTKTNNDGGVNWKFINRGLSLTVRVYKDGSDYKMQIANRQGTGEDVRKVDAVYGGGVNKQRYLAKLTGYWSTLPLQFNSAGDDAYTDRTSKVWRDYHGDWWYDEATKQLKTPAAGSSFEKNCMSCHAVGVRIDPADGYKAKNLVVDAANGDFDFDGDGVKEELNVGCETCHGPGSAHVAAGGKGKDIVSLKLLTPEREAMVCGQCHSRPKGAFNTDSPVNAEGWMMRAGTSRAEFLTSFATSQRDAAPGDLWGDAATETSIGNHSKAHHQQYTDFIRSKLYRNSTRLLTCSACHDPHGPTANARQLRQSPSQNAALCGSCHTEDESLGAHLTAKSIPNATTKATFALCTDCHMPKTAKTGAGEPGSVAGYWWNDVTSHAFDVPKKQVSIDTKMPTAYTNPCGGCHGSGM